MLGKRKKGGIQGEIDDVKEFFKNEEIEEVPQQEVNDLPDGYESMDSDDLAETRALAKKMLRKKFRSEIIDASFNRYAYDDEGAQLPSWFV